MVRIQNRNSRVKQKAMQYLGFRCWPDQFTYVVLQGTVTAPKPVTSGTVKIPADSDRPAFLNWISTEVRTILKRHTPTGCSYKAIEPKAQKNSSLLRRAQVEGVVQAVVHESGCRDIASYTKQQIKARIGFGGTAKDVAQALDGGPLQEFSGNDFEEAALAAWVSLPD
jgi:Holliday junction resolvasome RuvABC endonuclease subunit